MGADTRGPAHAFHRPHAGPRQRDFIFLFALAAPEYGAHDFCDHCFAESFLALPIWVCRRRTSPGFFKLMEILLSLPFRNVFHHDEKDHDAGYFCTVPTRTVHTQVMINQ